MDRNDAVNNTILTSSDLFDLLDLLLLSLVRSSSLDLLDAAATIAAAATVAVLIADLSSSVLVLLLAAAFGLDLGSSLAAAPLSLVAFFESGL